MPSRIIIVIILTAIVTGLTLAPAPLSAQNSTGVDSVDVDSLDVDSLASDQEEYRTGELEEEVVVVRASRLRSIEAAGVRAVTGIDRDMIEESGRDDLADALLLSPGVFIRRYGGAGSLATLSLRGTAAGQTKVFVDGLPWRTSADGAADLGNIPLENIEEIEVVRGGDGALYGSNALGGVVNIRTGAGTAPSYRSTFSIGSFGQRSLTLSTVHPVHPVHTVHIHAAYQAATNNYPFTFREFGETREVRRENSQHHSFNAGLGWRYERDPMSAAISLDGFTTRRGVPGGVTQGNRELTAAELGEREVSGTARLDRTFGPLILSSALRIRLNHLRYTDPDARFAGPEGVDNEYERGDLLGQVRGVWVPNERTAIEGVIDLDRSRLVGDNLDPSVGDEVKRTRLGGLLHITRHIDSLLLLHRLTLDGGIRLDRFSDLGSYVSPSIGLVLQPAPCPLRLRGHLALNYRAPTFNEQYYLNIGNSDVGVERSTSLTIGTTWTPTENLLLEGSLFRIDTRDRIVSIPRSPISWTTLNIGRVESEGVEFGLRGSVFEGTLSGALAYTRMATIDCSGGVTDGHRVPYAPDEVVTVALVTDLGLVRLNTSVEYTSHRYSLAWNSPETALPRYAVVDLGLMRTVRIGSVALDGSFSVRNILDVDYQVIRNYPMPGRSLHLNLTLQLPNDTSPE